jgi:6-phospho-3-hexuloisomerase
MSQVLSSHLATVIREVASVLENFECQSALQLVQAVSQASKIVTCGAGRMGLMARAFAMRLKHLNRDAYHIGDCNVPRIGPGDLLVACSGSGETKTVLTLVETAKFSGASVALLTTRESSSMEKLADIKIILPAPSKVENGVVSMQPMTTLTEQSTLLFLDGLILMLMDQLRETNETMKTRHSILE